MFTGIVERTAEVGSWVSVETGARMGLLLPGIVGELELGESVAVNGCCLTVAEFGSDQGEVYFDLLAETLRLTNLGDLRAGSVVNVERALRVGDRLSGHFVQGHVDGRAEVLALEKVGQDHQWVVSLPSSLARYTIHKGSIAVDGMSLTIAELDEDRFTIWITPHTFAVTNLAKRQAGEMVNLEVDMLAKYLERRETMEETRAGE